jgi:hypothetical protein
MKSIVSRFLLVLVLVLSFSLIIASPVRGDVSIDTADGGGAISADTSQGAAGEAWTSLDALVIDENANDDIAASQTDVTLILHAPAGFRFRAGVNPNISGPAGDITAIVVTSTTATDITITFSTDALADADDVITIGDVTAIDVQPTAGTPLATGNILSVGSTCTIAGIDGATNFGTLTEVAGAITGLAIIQEPTDTLVNVAIAPAITVRATDQFTNNVSGQNVVATLIAGTGALGGTDTQATNANGIATFNDLTIDTVGPGKQLRFTATVTVDSALFNIVTYGITVNPTSGLITTEDGGTDTFTIVLNTQPANDVTIGLTSSKTWEGLVSADSVTFTNGNWNTPQTITVTGVDDVEVDGDSPYTIITAPSVSADGNYNNIDADDVSVINVDNDVGGGGGEPAPGTNDFSDIVTSSGEFTQEVTATSNDNQVELNIDAGIVGQTSTGQPVSQISIFRMYSPPAPPADASVIGLTYDFRPDGATFSEPVTITFTYNPNNIPAGFNEEDLSIALYNESTGEWVVLDNIVVDTVNHTITGETNHFSAFTVMAFTVPAAFSVSNLTLSPTEVDIDEVSTVSVTVANTGDLSGTYDVVLMIDSAVTDTTQVTLGGNTSQVVSFEVSLDTAGSTRCN